MMQTSQQIPNTEGYNFSVLGQEITVINVKSPYSEDKQVVKLNGKSEYIVNCNVHQVVGEMVKSIIKASMPVEQIRESA